MPTSKPAYKVLVLSPEESADVKAKAEAAGLSVSNWFRVQAGLPEMVHGKNFKNPDNAKHAQSLSIKSRKLKA